MLKLTAVAAALSFSLLPPAASARPEKAPEADPEEQASPTPLRCKPVIVEPVIEEIPASAPPVPPDLSPIVLTPADWPRRAAITQHLQDPAVVASIPTWPTWYESVYLPSQAQAQARQARQGGKTRAQGQGQPGRYTARYRSPAAAAPDASAPVVWGPDVVPIVEVLPPAASPPSRR